MTREFSVFFPSQFLPICNPHCTVTLGICMAGGKRCGLTFDLIFLSCRLTLDLSFFKKSGLLFDFIISGEKQNDQY